MQDPFARLYSAVGETEPPEDDDDPFGRLYSAVEIGPEGRPLTDRDLSEMASSFGGAGIPLEDREPPGELPSAGFLTRAGEGPSSAGPPSEERQRAPVTERMAREIEQPPPYRSERELRTLEAIGRGLATSPGQVVEGLGANVQATSAEPPPEEEVYGPTTGGFLEALQNLARKVPLPQFIEEEPTDYREALESGREAVRGAGRDVEQVGRESREYFEPEGGPPRHGEEGFYPYAISQGVGQIGQQIALSQVGGGGLPSQVARFALPSAALEGGQQYIETRDRLIEEGVPQEEAERQAAVESAVTGGGAAATEAVPGFAALRKMERAGGPMTRAVIRAFQTGGAEAVQEPTQGTISDVVSYAGGDERALENFLQRREIEAKVGGAAGLIGGGVVGGVEMTQPGSQGPTEGLQAPTEPPVEPVTTDEGAATEPEPTPTTPQGPAVRLSGNERGMLVQRAADLHPDRFEDYATSMVDRYSDFGFDNAYEVQAHAESITEQGGVPELVRVIDRGQPIPGELRGGETTILTAEGEELPAYYAIIPGDAAPTSHDPIGFDERDDSPAAKYQDRRYHADPEAKQTVASRAQDLQPARLLDTSSDPTVGPPIVDPVEDPETAPELMAQFNEPLTKSRDPLAEAATHARRLEEDQEALRHFNNTIDSGETIRSYLDSASGREFVEKLVGSGVIPRQKASQFIDRRTGMMNDEGKTLVERTMLAAAVRDPDVIDRAPKSFLRNIEKAVPAIVRTKKFEGWDLAPLLQDALDAGAKVRATEGLTYGDLNVQPSLEGDVEFSPEAVQLAQFMEENSPNRVSEAIRFYAADAEASQTHDMFGDRPVTPEESVMERFATEAEQEVAEEPGSVEVSELREVDGERVTEAVVIGPGGREFTGHTHADALDKLQQAGYSPSDAQNVDLFRTSEGRLIDRYEALREFGGASAESFQDAEGRLRGPELSEPEVQGDLLGGAGPAEGGDQFSMGLEGEQGPEGLTDAERRARETVEQLRPLVEEDAASEQQLSEYRDALALLNREGPQTEEETQIEARLQGSEETEPGQQTLLEPDDAESVVNREDPLAPEEEPEAGEQVEEGDSESPIGGRMRGRMERPADWEGGPVSRMQVMNELAKALEEAGGKVPLRLGRTPAGARGVFKVRPEVVRVRQADDLPNAWHETAHALEKLVYGWPDGSPWTSPLVSERMEQELVALGKALYGDEKPSGGYKREGFAEFLKLWGTEDSRVEQASRFLDWFEGTFMEEHPEVAEQLRTAREATRTWREQGAAERARQSVTDPLKPSRRLRAMWKKVQQFVSLEEQVESFQPLYELAEAAEESLGRDLDPSEHPYVVPAALATVESTRVKYMIQRGMIDLAGNRTGGPSMQDVANLVKQAELPSQYSDFSTREAFTIYLWARRTEALQTDPEGQRESGMSLEDARKIIDDLESERFREAAGLWYQWNQGVLDYAAEASPTFAEIVERVRERDPGSYMPLQRVFDDLDDMWGRAGARGGPAGPTSPVQRLKGSARDIKDPIQTAIAQAEATLRAAHRRKTLDTMIRLSGVEGLGGLIEEVPRDMAPVATRDLSEVMSKVRRELADVADVKIETDPGEDLDLTARTLTFFAPAEHPSGAEPIVPLFDGETGKVRWFRMDESLMRSLEALVPQRQTEVTGLAVADELMKKWARGFRAGTTGLRASFGLVWNMMRDPQTMYVNSKSSAAGPRLLVEWVRGMLDVGLNKTTGREASEWVDTYMRLGTEMSQSLGQDIPHTRAAARKLFQGRAVKTLDPRNWFEWYREVVQFPEAAPRVAELKTVAEDMGWKPGEPLTLDQSLQLLLASKQVTTDFSAAGHFARKWNQIVPFYNASIQGPRANVRAARRNPQKFMLRGLQLTALSLLLWWQYKDEEWWKEMDAREKFLHWHVPIDWPEPTLTRIPRAFEVGLIFSALPEALADGWYQQDPEAVEEWFDVFREAASLPVMPQPLSVAFEQAANERFFFDSPIVPMSVERKPAEEQYNEYTSRLAVELGDLFNVSPMRIDHAIDGTFGPMGGDLLAALGMGPPERDREKELADLPVVGRMFLRGGRMGRIKTVDDLYDTLEEAQKRQASGKVQETDRERQLRLQLQDASQAISALYFIKSHTEQADVRRQINDLIADFSQDALRAYEMGTLNREPFKAARKKYEGIEERMEAQLQGREPEPEGRLSGRSRSRSRSRQR